MLLIILTILKWLLIIVGIISAILGIGWFLAHIGDKDDDGGTTIACLSFAALCLVPAFFVNLKTNHLKEPAKIRAQLQSYLVSVQEPKLFIIAPMTYDTSAFEKRNSGGRKDNSTERLIRLEEAVTKFENYIDDKAGFSFIDRSKIAQIEREHKFQLSDWSNDEKTAEIGRALNANVLLFLDKFNYLEQNGGEYRFEAKFVDINTMQTTTYLLVYTGNKLKEPTETLEKMNFRNFTQITSAKNPFADELKFSVTNSFKMKQDSKLVFGRNLKTCPLGFGEKMEFDEFDMETMKDRMLEFKSIHFDGEGSVVLENGSGKSEGTYTFEPINKHVEKIGNDFYTDGRIGTLSISADGFYKKYDVFTINNREYYLHLGTAELKKATVNYYLQMVRN